MALWPAFIGGTYQSRSPTLDGEVCLNLMPVTIDSATNAKKSMLLGTPGLRRLLSVSSQSCRGLYSEDGRTFAVVGDQLYELDLTTNTATPITGTIANDDKPVFFASNGRGGEQLAICGGGELKVLNLTTTTLSSAVSLPLTNAPRKLIGFVDGYFHLLESDTVKVYFSALEDGTSWDALDFYARSQTSDNLIDGQIIAGKIWLLGSKTVDVWVDSGDVDTPFVPYSGTQLAEGAISPWGSVVFGNSLFWLSQSTNGTAHIVKAGEGGHGKISTDAIDFMLGEFAALDDCEALAFEQDGHPFIVWTFPSGETGTCHCGVSIAWDDKEQLWHQKASFDAVLGTFYRWRVRGICTTAQGLICGDYSTAEIYELDLDTQTENGNLIKRVRRSPYLSSENQFLFLDAFELGIQAGVGLNAGQGVDPQLMLRVSRDAGKTFGPSVTAPMGAMGHYLERAAWRRLGRSRADRLVIEVSVTDPVPVSIGPGAWLRTTPGTGQL